MDFKDKKLYHQIHPLKLPTDISVTPASLYLLWHHRIVQALALGFFPPIAVSVAMMIWPPDFEQLKISPLGKYISKHMTPGRRSRSFSDLNPNGRRAWIHNPWLIAIGLGLLLLAWCNGLIIHT